MSKKTIFVSGVFNVLHPGHLRLLKYARDLGDRLVVGVVSDEIAGPSAHVPQELRLDGVQLNGLVDEAFLITTSVVDEIARLRPSIVVKGKEHAERENPEIAALRSYGGRLFFSSGEVTFTSQDLIQKELQRGTARRASLPVAYMARRSIANEQLLRTLSDFKTLRVVVVGDTIVDEYVTCEPLGMSEEDPTVVVTPISTDRFIGGAAVVAAHAASLGANVAFVSVVGNDEPGRYVESELQGLGVTAQLNVDDTRPTTLKQRFRAHDKTLLRVSQLSQRSVDLGIQSQLVSQVSAAVRDADVLVFSDFNYGVLPQAVVDRISGFAHAGNIAMVADSQSSSQLGDISRYCGMTILSATEREARLALRNSEDGINTVAHSLLSKTRAANLILKLGSDGALIMRRTDSAGNYEIEQLPALNSSPRDVAGAGDSLLVTAALALASGASIWESSLLGSIAAAVQVSRVGNIPIMNSEIARELDA
jgi:rfaE bifunctional protein kinase chain/domain